VKAWVGYGSEHSSRLVMIGRFREAADAKTVESQIKRLEAQVREDVDSGRFELGWGAEDRFTDGILQLLGELSIHSLSPTDTENFAYDYSLSLKENELVLETQEIDVTGFLKLMVDGGARVEVYSGHFYPDEASDTPTSD
jgi:hypothetical protein